MIYFNYFLCVHVRGICACESSYQWQLWEDIGSLEVRVRSGCEPPSHEWWWELDSCLPQGQGAHLTAEQSLQIQVKIIQSESRMLWTLTITLAHILIKFHTQTQNVHQCLNNNVWGQAQEMSLQKTEARDIKQKSLCDLIMRGGNGATINNQESWRIN